MIYIEDYEHTGRMPIIDSPNLIRCYLMKNPNKDTVWPQLLRDKKGNTYQLKMWRRESDYEKIVSDMINPPKLDCYYSRPMYELIDIGDDSILALLLTSNNYQTRLFAEEIVKNKGII